MPASPFMSASASPFGTTPTSHCMFGTLGLSYRKDAQTPFFHPSLLSLLSTILDRVHVSRALFKFEILNHGHNVDVILKISWPHLKSYCVPEAVSASQLHREIHLSLSRSRHHVYKMTSSRRCSIPALSCLHVHFWVRWYHHLEPR